MLVGGGRRADDRLVRGEPRALGRARRLADAPAAPRRDEPTSSSPAAAGSSARTSSSGSSADGRRGRSSRAARDYDLTRWDDAERLFARRAARARLPPRRRGRRHRREPREPGPLLVREPDDGRARARAARALHGVAKLVDRRHGLRLPEVHAGAVLARTTSGTATRRRRTRRTASRRSRSSSARRPTASSTGSTRSSCCRRTSTGRATTSTSRPRT